MNRLLIIKLHEFAMISYIKMFRKLEKRSNWISEYSIMKRAVNKFTSMFKTEMAKFINIKHVSHFVSENTMSYDRLGRKLLTFTELYHL